MFCKKCGKELADNAKFCDQCGCQVNDVELNLTSDPILWRNIGIIVVVCLIAFLAVAIYNNGGIAVVFALGK